MLIGWLGLDGKKKKNKRPGDLRKGPRRYQIRKEEGRKHRDCGGLSARLILFCFVCPVEASLLSASCEAGEGDLRGFS